MDQSIFSKEKNKTLFTQRNPPVRELLCTGTDSCGMRSDFSYSVACPGDTVYFRDESYDTSGQKQAVNWLWDFGDGSGISGTGTPSHVYAQAGAYTVRLVVYGDTTPFCTDTIAKTVLISDSLQLGAFRTDTICLGDTVRLPVAKLYCGTPDYSYAWSPGGSLSDSTAARPQASPGQTTEYTLTVRDSTGSEVSATYRLYVDPGCCVSFARFRVSDTVLCEGDTLKVTDLSTTTGSVQYEWDFGGSASPSSYQGKNPPGIRFSSPGRHELKLVIRDACRTDTALRTIYVNPLPYSGVRSDTQICRGDTVMLGEGTLSDLIYQWTPQSYLEGSESGSPRAWPPSDISYSVEIENKNTGCVTSDSIRIRIREKAAPGLPDSALLCLPGLLALEADTAGIDSLLWSNGSRGPKIKIDSGGWWWAESANICGKVRDSVYVTESGYPANRLPRDTFLCDTDTLYLTQGRDRYLTGLLWSTGSRDSTIGVTGPGTLWVESRSLCGVRRDTIEVVQRYTPAASGLPADTFYCEGGYVDLRAASGNAVDYSWTPGDTGRAIRITQGGRYELRIRNECGVRTEIISVAEYPYPEIELPGDTILCQGDTLFLEPVRRDSISGISWSDGRQGPGIEVTAGGVYLATAINGCGEKSDSIRITGLDRPVVQLPADTGICYGDTIRVRAYSDYDNYRWSTGEEGSYIIAVSGGLLWLESENVCGSRRDSMQVYLYALPEVDAGPDSSISLGSRAMLVGQTDASYYRWLSDSAGGIECDSCLETWTAALDSSIYYYLLAVDSNGCRALDTVYIRVSLICSDVMLPNAFSPNGDGLNDEYRALSKGNNEEFIVLELYNRWGEQLFRTTEKSKGWDGSYRGKAQEPGVYTYVMRYRCEGQEYVVRGNFMLIR